jgi:DNA-binding NarL/FixJ family response regulator
MDTTHPSCVRVVLAEANHLNCQLVENAFRPSRMRVAIIGSAVESSRALELLKLRDPDVAVISAQLEDGPLQGFRLLEQLRVLHSRTCGIVLLSSRDPDLVVDAFRYGAHGVVFRDEPIQTLARCIHAVNDGQIWANSEQLRHVVEALGQALPSRIRNSRGLDRLSKREADVARLVAEGWPNRAISEELGLSSHTIRNYLLKIYDKVGVSSRVELALYCVHARQRNLASGNLESPALFRSMEV